MVFTWMGGKRVLVSYVTVWSSMQSQHCNDDNNGNDDNVMCASVWFEFFGAFVLISNHVVYGREICDQKE